MTECLRAFYGDSSSTRWNVMSIGDSVVEEKALTQLIKGSCDGFHALDGSYCKTVNLSLHPPLVHLTNELRLVLAWLPTLVGHKGDIDWQVESLDPATLLQGAPDLE